MKLESILEQMSSLDPARSWTPAQLDITSLTHAIHWDGAAFRFDRARDADLKAVVSKEVFAGAGFCVLKLLDAKDVDDHDLEQLSHVLAGTFGTLMPQNAAGDISYRVKASIGEGRPAYRLSNTSGDTSMHTDCSYGDKRPSAISLFCINPAAEGGESLICNAYSVLARYLAENPGNMQPLTRSFLFHRSHKRQPEDEMVARYPLVEIADGSLSFRYKWPYIELGHRARDFPLHEDEVRFFRSFEEIANRDDLVFRYGLQRGECLIGNNRWIFHNRTPYRDLPGRPPRLVIRHWIDTEALV